MFGKKETQPIETVPVLTVETLPKPYEPIKTVMVSVKWTQSSQHETALQNLSILGAKEGYDAIIGVRFHTPTGTSIQNLYAYGTGIRYIEEE